MPEISLDKLIGVTLVADTNVPKLNSFFKKIGEFKKGDSIGIIWSWVEENGKVYYQIKPTIGKIYYVEHRKGYFKITDELKRIFEQDKDKIEQQKKEEKGAFQYYIEKYGPYVLLTFIAIAVIKKKL